MTRKNIWKSALWYFFCMVTVIQSLAMLYFFGTQFTKVTMYADTAEYLEIARSLQTDEYMGILYPLLLRGTMWLENVLVIKYYQITYIVQLAAMIMATAYFVASYFDFGKSKVKFYVVVSYLVSIPMIAVMYTRLEPVVLQVVLWLFLLGSIKRMWIAEKKNGYSLGILITSAAMVLLIPNDRYVLLFFYAVITAMVLVRKQEWRRIGVMSILFLVCAALCTGFLQSGEGRGRMEHNLSSAWFLECTSPHFAKDYVCWPEEVRAVIPLEEAVLMVRRDDGLLMGIDQRLVEVYGREKTNGFYRQMGNTAFGMHTKETVYSVRDDVIQGVLTPFSIMNHKNSGYNSKDGYRYSEFPAVFGNAGKYIYFGSVLALAICLLGKAAAYVSAMIKEKRVMAPVRITRMLMAMGILQVIVSACFDVGAMDYANYPMMIFLWYFMAIVI